MKTAFRESFSRDLDKLKRDRRTLDRVKAAIESVEEAVRLEDVPGVKKLSGSDKYYRIRTGDHRIGIMLDGETIVFVRCLHRRDIYRYFP